MVKLLKKIKQDSKQALKQGEKDKAKTLRYLAAIIQTKQVEMGQDFSKQDAIQVLQKELKQKKESLEAFEKADREDLASKEKEEIKLLKQYLPKMMDEGEIKQVVERVIKEQESKDFGRIMGQVMAEVKGRAEGDKVSKVVRDVLNQ